MTKLTLTDLVNLQNENSAVTAINNNNSATETALENTLSRDGASPNSMNASLDMNSNRIINLPAASSDTEPVRKIEWAANLVASGSGDVIGPSSAVDGSLTLFDGISGKLIKQSTTTGVLKATSGVVTSATAGTDYYAPGSTDVAVTDGGTGASTAANARTNLGVVPGTDVQAYNTSLKNIADVTFAQGDVLYHNGTAVVKLSPGTPGNVLTTAGAGANPAWSPAGGSFLGAANTWTNLNTYTGGVTMSGSNPTLSSVASQGPLLLKSGGPQVTWWEDDLAGYTTGTAQAGGAATITLAAGASAHDNYTRYLEATVTITSGTGAGQIRLINAYNGTTKVATVSVAWVTPPDNTSVYSIGRTDYGYHRAIADDNCMFFELWESSSPTGGYVDGPFGQQDEWLRFNRWIHSASMNYPLTGNGNREWSLAANYVWDEAGTGAEPIQTAQDFKLKSLNAATYQLVDALVLKPNNAAPYFYTPSGVKMGVGTGTQPTATLEAQTSFAIRGSSSGSTMFNVSATASGTLTLPSATDTLVGKATTDTLTNKTLDSAGTGNVLKVSGVTVSAGQYPGTTTNDSATAGNRGESVTSSVAVGSAVSMTSGIAVNITSISLTAGDWDVSANPCFTGGVTTTATYLEGSISTTTGTVDDTPGNAWITPCFNSTPFSGNNIHGSISSRRMSLSGTTTVYLVAKASFATSTCSTFGILKARRVR